MHTNPCKISLNTILTLIIGMPPSRSLLEISNINYDYSNVFPEFAMLYPETMSEFHKTRGANDLRISDNGKSSLTIITTRKI